MPAERLTMRKIREVFRLKFDCDISNRQIAKSCNIARSTVKDIPGPALHLSSAKLIARHVRNYDRRQDIELPDHPKALLAQRRKARDQKIFMRFISLSDKAEASPL